MLRRLEERIAYGRSIRERAESLIEAHGPGAVALAREAADEVGMPEIERVFWQAVAARVARLAPSHGLPSLRALPVRSGRR